MADGGGVLEEGFPRPPVDIEQDPLVVSSLEIGTGNLKSVLSWLASRFQEQQHQLAGFGARLRRVEAGGVGDAAEPSLPSSDGTGLGLPSATLPLAKGMKGSLEDELLAMKVAGMRHELNTMRDELGAQPRTREIYEKQREVAQAEVAAVSGELRDNLRESSNQLKVDLAEARNELQDQLLRIGSDLLERFKVLEARTLKSGQASSPTNAGNASSPTDAGKASSPKNAGNASSPTDDGKASSPKNAGKEPSPTDAGKASSPKNAGKESSPTDAGKASSLKNAGKESSPTDAGKSSSSKNAGKESSPTDAGKASSPTDAGKASLPKKAENASSPKNAGNASSPTDAGKASSPKNAGEESSPAETGRASLPVNSAGDNRRTSGGPGHKDDHAIDSQKCGDIYSDTASDMKSPTLGSPTHGIHRSLTEHLGDMSDLKGLETALRREAEARVGLTRKVEALRRDLVTLVERSDMPLSASPDAVLPHPDGPSSTRRRSSQGGTRMDRIGNARTSGLASATTAPVPSEAASSAGEDRGDSARNSTGSERRGDTGATGAMDNVYDTLQQLENRLEVLESTRHGAMHQVNTGGGSGDAASPSSLNISFSGARYIQDNHETRLGNLEVLLQRLSQLVATLPQSEDQREAAAELAANAASQAEQGEQHLPNGTQDPQSRPSGSTRQSRASEQSAGDGSQRGSTPKDPQSQPSGSRRQSKASEQSAGDGSQRGSTPKANGGIDGFSPNTGEPWLGGELGEELSAVTRKVTKLEEVVKKLASTAAAQMTGAGQNSHRTSRTPSQPDVGVGGKMELDALQKTLKDLRDLSSSQDGDSRPRSRGNALHNDTSLSRTQTRAERDWQHNVMQRLVAVESALRGISAGASSPPGTEQHSSRRMSSEQDATSNNAEKATPPTGDSATVRPLSPEMWEASQKHLVLLQRITALEKYVQQQEENGMSSFAQVVRPQTTETDADRADDSAAERVRMALRLAALEESVEQLTMSAKTSSPVEERKKGSKDEARASESAQNALAQRVSAIENQLSLHRRDLTKISEQATPKNGGSVVDESLTVTSKSSRGSNVGVGLNLPAFGGIGSVANGEMRLSALEAALQELREAASGKPGEVKSVDSQRRRNIGEALRQASKQSASGRCTPLVHPGDTNWQEHVREELEHVRKLFEFVESVLPKDKAAAMKFFRQAAEERAKTAGKEDGNTTKALGPDVTLAQHSSKLEAEIRNQTTGLQEELEKLRRVIGGLQQKQDQVSSKTDNIAEQIANVEQAHKTLRQEHDAGVTVPLPMKDDSNPVRGDVSHLLFSTSEEALPFVQKDDLQVALANLKDDIRNWLDMLTNSMLNALQKKADSEQLAEIARKVTLAAGVAGDSIAAFAKRALLGKCASCDAVINADPEKVAKPIPVAGLQGQWPPRASPGARDNIRPPDGRGATALPPTTPPPPSGSNRLPRLSHGTHQNSFPRGKILKNGSSPELRGSTH